MGKQHDQTNPGAYAESADQKMQLRDIAGQAKSADHVESGAHDKKKASDNMHAQFKEARVAAGEAAGGGADKQPGGATSK